MPDDATLLSDFLAGSQGAFAELVRRHMNLVYAAARRQVRDPDVAEDVAQAVFIILSRRAGSLRASPTIAGWLVKTTRYVASNALRAQRRRQKHEQVAAMLATQLDTGNRSSEITAVLDDALSKLRPNDRSALSMRYLQNRSVEEISTELRISPPAAAKRIERALDRLRSHLTRRGVATSVVAITAVLTAESSIAAPPALTSTAATGTFNSAACSLAKGTLAAMLRTKLFATVAALIFVITGAGVTAHFLKADSPAPIAAAPAHSVIPVVVAKLSAPTTAPADAMQLNDDGWTFKSVQSGDYGLFNDETDKLDGVPTVCVESIVDHPQGEGIRSRIIPAIPFRGKRMTFAADLRMQDITSVAGLDIGVVNLQHQHNIVNGDFADRHIIGTVPWQHYTYTFDIPADAIEMGVAMSIRGSGKLWGRNFCLYPADKNTPVNDDSAWHIWSYTPAGFNWGKDPAVQRNGHPAWFIDAANALPGQFAYFDSNNRHAENLAGKRLRYTVWLKCENVIPPSGITFRIMRPGLVAPRYGKPGLIGTKDWQKYEMVLDVNDKAAWICPGVKIQSSGKVWIDEPKVEVVEKTVPLTK
jgi:RNA polymerase sigma factor (sigma-70 family)